MIVKTLGCSRFVYNYFLEYSNSLYKNCKKSSSYEDNAKLLTQLKKETAFLNEVDSIALQQSLKHLRSAFKNFFEGRADFPKFKKNNLLKNIQQSMLMITFVLRIVII